jgi:hypothetical protein
MFLYGTGARIEETLALTQDDVDLRNHTVDLPSFNTVHEEDSDRANSRPMAPRILGFKRK